MSWKSSIMVPVLGLGLIIVEARKLEHHSPHALKVNYKGS